MASKCFYEYTSSLKAGQGLTLFDSLTVSYDFQNEHFRLSVFLKSPSSYSKEKLTSVILPEICYTLDLPPRLWYSSRRRSQLLNNVYRKPVRRKEMVCTPQYSILFRRSAHGKGIYTQKNRTFNRGRKLSVSFSRKFLVIHKNSLL